MKDLAGKVAFVTGGAAGMGLGMSKAFAEAGMKLVIADIRESALAEAADTLRKSGHVVHTIALDVTDRDAWVRAADEAERQFGKVHLLCHNVGGGGFGHLKDASYDDWDWLIDLNLGAAINAVHNMLPRMRAHGEGGHIVVTSSMAGIVPVALGGVYSVAKMAVVGMMESLRTELADENIGVSVLCPGLTRTSGATTGLRPPKYGETGFNYAPLGPPPGKGGGAPSFMAEAMDPDEVGRRVLEGVLRNRLYILTHSEFGQIIRPQFQELLDAMPPMRAPPPGAPRPGVGVRFGAVYATARPEG